MRRQTGNIRETVDAGRAPRHGTCRALPVRLYEMGLRGETFVENLMERKTRARLRGRGFAQSEHA